MKPTRRQVHSGHGTIWNTYDIENDKTTQWHKREREGGGQKLHVLWTRLIGVRDQFRLGGWGPLPEYFLHCLPENPVVLPEYYLSFLPEYGYFQNSAPPPPASYAYDKTKNKDKNYYEQD